jgi:hypothetical protein
VGSSWLDEGHQRKGADNQRSKLLNHFITCMLRGNALPTRMFEVFECFWIHQRQGAPQIISTYDRPGDSLFSS